jgi:chromosome segregation ATPase
MKKLVVSMVLMAVAQSAAMDSRAQTVRNSAPAANAQQMLQLQQLASERTALQTENGKLKADLDKMRKELDGLKRSRSAADQRSRASESAAAAAASAAATQSQADVERARADLAGERERMQELVTRFRETATTLRDVETERSAARQSLLERDRELKVCVDRNRGLYSLNTEVLKKFEDQGFWSSLASREPFTQLKRVELENLIDGYRDGAQDQLVLPEQSPPAQ